MMRVLLNFIVCLIYSHTNLKTVLFIMVNGQMVKEMAEVLYIGKMEVFMKDFGKIMWLA